MAADFSTAIVGYGAVGRGIHQLFPDASPFDPPQGIGTREEVNACRFAFVCVPTPMARTAAATRRSSRRPSSWIEVRVHRPSLDRASRDHRRLRAATGKAIVFQPEYGPAETPDHPFNDLREGSLGDPRRRARDTVPVADLYKTVFNADFVIQQTDAKTAELTKYMENAFLATKVTFCNEFYDIAEAWASTTTSYASSGSSIRGSAAATPSCSRDSRGFGGRCLPKDLSSIIDIARRAGVDAGPPRGCP